MQQIPLNAVPAQQLDVILSDQSCTIRVFQNMYGVFCDLYVNDALVVAGRICQDANRIVRSVYLGFIGDLVFLDTQGADDPDYTGFGTRFQFCYLDPDDLATRGLVS